MKRTVKVNQTVYSSGPDKGLPCISVEGAGLQFVILPSHSLDIGPLYFNGIPISYNSTSGYSGSFEPNGEFAGGMLMTCGLENTGPACEIDGIYYPMHGSVRFCQAENIKLEHKEKTFEVTGTVRSGPFKMKRTIRFDSERRIIYLKDNIVNTTSKNSPCFLMYHVNYGAPFLDLGSSISIPIDNILPKNEDAEKYIDKWDSIYEAEKNSPAQVYFIKPKQGIAEIHNSKLGINVKLKFDLEELPKLDVWKLFRQKEYVVSFEPCLEFALGRKRILDEGRQFTLKPGEELNSGVELEFAIE